MGIMSNVQYVKPLASSSFDPTVSEIFCLCLFFCFWHVRSSSPPNLRPPFLTLQIFPQPFLTVSFKTPVTRHRVLTCPRTACMLVCHFRKKKKKQAVGKLGTERSVAYSPRLKKKQQTRTLTQQPESRRQLESTNELVWRVTVCVCASAPPCRSDFPCNCVQ